MHERVKRFGGDQNLSLNFDIAIAKKVVLQQNFNAAIDKIDNFPFLNL